MMRTAIILGAAFAVSPAMAGEGAEFPTAVSDFEKICLIKSVASADRIKILEEAVGWAEDEMVTVDIPALEISKAITRNYSFKNVESARQWTGSIDGSPARIVIASFSGKARYQNICALIMAGAENAMPYGSDLRAAFKKFGIGGKSVDLVHYYEFAGKLKPGDYAIEKKHPARGEIFTRSRASLNQKTMHIYVAY